MPDGYVPTLAHTARSFSRGDNDRLAALVASMLGVDLLMLLSDVEGLHDGQPSAGAPVINEVHDLSTLDDRHRGGTGSAVGSGGMAGILAKMELVDDDYDRERMEAVELPLDRVTAWSERLWGLPLAKRREITGLPAKRADVALFGSLIYEQVMRQLGFVALRVSTRGIRFGILQSCTFSKKDS